MRKAIIGIRAMVLPGAVIGKQALVAAGSVVPVKMQVPPRHVMAGVPAQLKKPLSDSALHWGEIAAPAYEALEASSLRQGLGEAVRRSRSTPLHGRTNAMPVRRRRS